MSLSIVTTTKIMVESKQVGNQPVGTNLYGWDDLFEKLVEFLGTPVAKQTIEKTTDSYTFSWAFDNKKFDIFNRLDLLRPDFVENSKPYIISNKEGKEWFENRSLDALEALKKFGPEKFIENIDSYSKSITFNQSLQELSIHIPELSKRKPNLILSKVNFLLDFLPAEDFKKMFEHVNLQNYITTKKDDFEKLLKKLSNVNSKEAKSYKEIFKSILDNYFPVMSDAFGGGTVGINKMMSFLEMPKSDKHKFLRKTPEGKIIAQKKDVKVAPDGTRTESDAEFELGDQLSLLPQKERRDLLKKNEEFIKSKIEGDSERKEINFLRLLFKESNPQEIQRNLKAEKERFIRYYDDPSHVTKYNILRGVHLPGIFEFYRMFNRGILTKYGKEEADKPYIKFDLEDIRDPQVAKIIINFFAKLYKVDKPESYSADSPDMLYTVLKDYVTMLEIAGESKEKIEEFIKKYKPTSLKSFKGNTSNISLVVYRKYYDFLTDFTSKEKSKEDIVINRDEIISRIGFGEYEKLISGFSSSKYNIEVGDFVEFLDRDVKENDSRYFALQKGYKYSIMDVDPEIINGIANSRIKVMGGNKKTTDWLEIKAFKWEEFGKVLMKESYVIRKIISKKLLEAYKLKTKKQ